MRVKVVLVAWMLLGFACLGARADEQAIQITKTPVNAKVRTFDPKNRPAEMPPLKPFEAALTESIFGCEVQLEVETTTGGGRGSRSTIVGIQVVLRLDVTEWLPEKASAKTIAHEAGHRIISEEFYRDAEQMAERLARGYLDRELQVERYDREGVRAGIQKAAREYCDAYLAAIQAPSQRAQEIYDKITDHGRNRVPEKEAIKRAIDTVKRQQRGQ